MDLVWKIVFNLMTVSVGDEMYLGYWPSSRLFKATATEHVTIPVFRNKTELFFIENFGSVEYV